MSLQETWRMWREAEWPKTSVLERRMSSIITSIKSNWPDYETVHAQTGVPSHVVACMDYREGGFSRASWLANGDPLFNSDGEAIETSHVPKGLGPAKSWCDAAVISLKYQNLDKIGNWDLCHALYVLEAWNGFGYANHGINTPYLWSKTQFYKGGLYSSDGVLNYNAFDYNFGCVPIFQEMRDKLGVDLKEAPYL